MDKHAGTAQARMYRTGRKTQRQKWGRQAVTANTPVTIATGLKGVDAVFVSFEGAVPAATGYELGTAGAITIESASNGTVSWMAVGW